MSFTPYIVDSKDMPKRKAQTVVPGFHLVKRRRTRQQYGGNFPVFRSMQPVQRGYGLGGMFRSLFRTVTPHLKKGLAHVGRRALTAGASALADMSENNTSLKDALKKQAKKEIHALNPINRLKSAGSNASTGEVRKRKASKKRKPKQKFTL